MYTPSDLLTIAKLCDQSYKPNGGTPSGNWRVVLYDSNRASHFSEHVNAKLGKVATDSERKKTQLDSQFVAYFNPVDNHLVIAFRGTDFSDPNDILNDIDIFFSGKPQQRTEDAVAFVQKAIKTVSSWHFWYQQSLFAHCHWSRPKVTLTGHSLGAAVAEAVCLQTGYSAATFDSPGLVPSGTDDINNFSKITAILNDPDLVNCCNPHKGYTYHLDAAGEVSIKKQATRKLVKFGVQQATAVVAPELVIPAYIKMPTKQLIPQFDPLQDTIRKHPISYFIKALQAHKQLTPVNGWPTLQEYLSTSDPEQLLAGHLQDAHQFSKNSS